MSAQALKRVTKNQIKVSTSLFLVLMLMLPPVVNMYVPQANAGTLTSYKLAINNSQAAASNVTYSFNWSTSATTSIKQIDIQICDAPTGACNAPAGFAAGNEPTLDSDNIAGTGRTVSSPTDNAFLVVVTTPSSQATQDMFLNFTGVTNPSTVNTTYYARTTTYSDTGSTIIDGPTSTAFAVLDTSSIAVSATVDSNFAFSVAGVSTGGNFNGGTGNVNVTSTATTIPFGNLVSGTAKVAAHDVTISTNASNGYTVTASHSATAQSGTPPLVSGSTNNIDTFTGTNGTPTTWSAPGGTTANTNTGFFGYSTEDATLCTGTAARFTSGGAKWAGSSTTGGEVICNATGITSQTTRVGWQAEVNSIQPAGAYTGTVVLVATPTY
jgi:hypothetical protein